MDEHSRRVVHSNKKDEWATPQDFFDKINKTFNFTLDPCATPNNAKCHKFYTMLDDGLSKSWKGETVFVNPPYSANKDWLKKCYEESLNPSTKVVVLIPSRTDTKYWHNYIMKAKEIYFIKGRLKFGGQKNSAPFPSCLVVFESSDTIKTPTMRTMERT